MSRLAPRLHFFFSTCHTHNKDARENKNVYLSTRIISASGKHVCETKASSGNIKQTSVSGWFLVFPQIPSHIQKSRETWKRHISATFSCVSANVNSELRLRKHLFPLAETWRKHAQNVVRFRCIRTATETWVSVTKPLWERFHVFLRRFRLRILRISSCGSSALFNLRLLLVYWLFIDVVDQLCLVSTRKKERTGDLSITKDEL